MSYFSFVLFYLVVLWRWKWWGLIRRTKNPEVSRRSGLQEETVSGIKSWINYCYLIHKLIYELCQWQAALDEYGSCLSLIPAGNTSVKRDVLEGIARCCCHLGKKEEALTACEKLVNLVNYWLQHILCKHLLIYCFIDRGQTYPTPATSPAFFSWSWVFMNTTEIWQTASPAFSSCAVFTPIIRGTGWVWPWAFRGSWSVMAVQTDPA